MEESKKPVPEEGIEKKDSFTFESPDEAKIDFEGIRALSRETARPDPFYLRLGHGLAEFFIRLLLLVGEVIFDVCKALVQVIVGVFKYGYLGCKGVFKWFRNKGRMLLETDWLRRLNLVFNGVGYAKSKQWGNMVVFLCVEALFVFYMVTVGGSAIHNFIHLGELSEDLIASSAHDVSVRWMVLGIMTFIVIVAYFIVWNKGVQGGYDMYQIENLYTYKQGHVDAMYVLSHIEEFDEDLSKLSRHKIRLLMRKKYGYSDISSRLISYVDFSHLPSKQPNFVVKGYLSARAWFYGIFKKAGDKLSKSTWHTIFAKYLVWEPKPYVSPYGISYVTNEATASYYRFIHTYDKYNDYVRHLRDSNSLLNVLKENELLIQCVFAEDKLSSRNGIAPIKRDDPKAKLSIKAVATRVVGSFECSFETALSAAKIAVSAVKLSRASTKKGEATTPEEELAYKYRCAQDALNEFVSKNDTSRLSLLKEVEKLLGNPSLLFEMADNGKTSFLNQLLLQHKVPKEVGALLYKEVRLSDHDAANLALRLAHFEEYVTQFENTPFHPAPMTFSKQLKQFGDEKFAVTVMALPTIGCLLVTIIPLIFSVLLAFTNWDTLNRGDNNFSWSNMGFPALFGMGEGNSTMPKTFVSLFVWTLVWAVFATLLNYILGIVLALLIQRKSIKGKGVWRTLFVISIAIPQFITLLVIAKFFGDQGAFNTFLGSFTHGIQIAGADGVVTEAYYVGSGTPDDPFRIVGDQGFLGWISGWKDWNGNSIVSGVKTLTNYVRLSDGTLKAEEISYVTSSSYIGFFSNTNWGGWDLGNALTVRAVLPKINIILINCWVGIPYTMLSTAGILMNIPGDLYESSCIDGAGAWKQFWKITMPYVLFVTGPSLLTQFIGNINNFNVIFFLTGGGPDSQMGLTAPAGYTDLLITWIYKMSVTATNKQYYLASAIGCVIFLICAFFSLIMYGKLGSTKNEEEFQ